MGLVSLDPFELDVLLETTADDCETLQEAEELQEEQSYAEKLRPLLDKHHWLLVTLLLMNSLANEALPIFLDRLVPSYLAVLLSVLGVLVFGEIIPSAYFTGPSQLKIAAKFAPLVKVIMFIFSPVTLPCSWLLDYFLGVDDRGIFF